ncbi:MAG: LpxD N-terminal domain-containing protein, partial [Acidobacteriota bacterium]|nr:LpxD N-terminal domain-containing protein [Acidobacteriota bacterium]
MKITVGKLAEFLGLVFEGDGSIEITGVSTMDKAGPADLVFFTQARLRPLLEGTRASAGILPAGEPLDRVPLKAVLRAEQPHLAFLRAIGLIIPPRSPAPG